MRAEVVGGTGGSREDDGAGAVVHMLAVRIGLSKVYRFRVPDHARHPESQTRSARLRSQLASQPERGLDVAEQLYAERNPILPFAVRYQTMNRVKDHPRFRANLAKMNLEP